MTWKEMEHKYLLIILLRNFITVIKSASKRLSRLIVVGDPTSPQTQDYGYPNCFTVWDPSPFNPPLLTGERWTQSPNSTFNDTTCNKIALPARLSFMAHSAPLDIKFWYPSTQ